MVAVVEMGVAKEEAVMVEGATEAELVAALVVLAARAVAEERMEALGGSTSTRVDKLVPSLHPGRQVSPLADLLLLHVLVLLLMLMCACCGQPRVKLRPQHPASRPATTLHPSHSPVLSLCVLVLLARSVRRGTSRAAEGDAEAPPESKVGLVAGVVAQEGDC